MIWYYSTKDNRVIKTKMLSKNRWSAPLPGKWFPKNVAFPPIRAKIAIPPSSSFWEICFAPSRKEDWGWGAVKGGQDTIWEYWINFRNVCTFQITLIHTLFSLFLKSSKVFSVSLTVNYFRKNQHYRHLTSP